MFKLDWKFLYFTDYGATAGSEVFFGETNFHSGGREIVRTLRSPKISHCVHKCQMNAACGHDERWSHERSGCNIALDGD
jgi:hypothetical protein